MFPFEITHIYATKQAIIYNYIQNKEYYVLTLFYQHGLLRIQSYDNGFNSRCASTYDNVYSELSYDIQKVLGFKFCDYAGSISIELYDDWRQPSKIRYDYIGSVVMQIDTPQFLKILFTLHKMGLYVSYENFNLAFSLDYDCYQQYLMTNAILAYNGEINTVLTDSEQLNLMSLLLESISPDQWPMLVPRSHYLKRLLAVMVAEYNYANGISDDYQLICSHFDLKYICWKNFLDMLSKYLGISVVYSPDNFLQQLTSDICKRILQIGLIKADMVLNILNVMQSKNYIQLLTIYKDLIKIE